MTKLTTDSRQPWSTAHCIVTGIVAALEAVPKPMANAGKNDLQIRIEIIGTSVFWGSRHENRKDCKSWV